MIRTETGACGERVRRARVCGKRVRRASGAQGHAGERASERERVEEVPDEGGFWLDLANLARAAKDRRGGEMRGENYRSTAQQVGCERRVLTLGARGIWPSAGTVSTTHLVARGLDGLWQAGRRQIATFSIGPLQARGKTGSSDSMDRCDLDQDVRKSAATVSSRAGGRYL